MEEKGQNYLIPTTYNEEDALDLDYKALKVATLLDKLDAAGCHLSLVLLDACRESVLPARNLGGASRGLGRGLAKIEAPTGTLISFACAPGKLASDGEGRNGVYTEQLLQHLPKTEDIEFVMRYVVYGVETATNGKQVPFRDSSLKAKPGQPGIYLIEPPKVAEAAPAAPRTSSMTALDEAAAAGANVAGLTEWLARIGLAKHENSVIPKLVTAGLLNVEELEELEEGDVADLGLPKFEQQKLANALKALAAERKAKETAERASKAEAERIDRERREKAEAECRVKEEAERKAKAVAEAAEAARRAKAEEEARKQAPYAALSVKAQEYLKQMEGQTMLNLRENNICAAGASALAEALKVNKTLTKLSAYSNKIGAAGARAIAEALKVNDTLTELYVWDNNIGVRGARAIAESLMVNNTLTELEVGTNDIGAAGASAIAEALKVNKTLNILSMWRNKIGAAGARAIAEALKVNTTLTKVVVDDNNIGDAGASAIAEALKVNMTLTELSIWSNNIRDAGASALRTSARSGCKVEGLPWMSSQMEANEGL